MSTVKKGQLIGKVAIVIALLTYALAVTFGSTAGANLAGSTFEGNDGNLTVDTIGMQDWVNAPNRTVACDLAAKLANANADCFTALGQTADLLAMIAGVCPHESAIISAWPPSPSTSPIPRPTSCSPSACRL